MFLLRKVVLNSIRKLCIIAAHNNITSFKIYYTYTRYKIRRLYFGIRRFFTYRIWTIVFRTCERWPTARWRSLVLNTRSRRRVQRARRSRLLWTDNR